MPEAGSPRPQVLPDSSIAGLGSLQFSLAFHEGDVAVHGKIGETLGLAVGQGPSYFQPVDFAAFSEAQDKTRVVRGKIAAAADFHAGLLEVAGLIGDARADSIGIGFFADEVE